MPETPRSVVAFDETVIDGKLKPFIEVTKSFAGANVIEIVSGHTIRGIHDPFYP